MELNRIRLATSPSAKAEHWLGDVRPHEGWWRFDVYDRQRQRVAQFQYIDRNVAEKSRAKIFSILGDAFDITFGVPTPAPSSKPDWLDGLG